jgi:hypothetical protein
MSLDVRHCTGDPLGVALAHDVVSRQVCYNMSGTTVSQREGMTSCGMKTRHRGLSQVTMML